MAYVYCHYKLGSPKKIFYIGVGGLNKFDNYKRAYSSSGRSKEWWGFVNRVGCECQIMEDNLTREEALIRERYWIKAIGRYDLGTGMLSNLTNGGEGSLGVVQTEEHKRKRLDKLKGRKRPEHVKKAMSRSGKPHTQETREKISKAIKGENNPFYGKKQPKWVKDINSKQVLNLETGIYYDSVREASETTNFKYHYFKSMLNGRCKNKTMFVHV